MTKDEAIGIVAGFADSIARERRNLASFRKLGDAELIASTERIVWMYADRTRALCEAHGLAVPPEVTSA